MVKVTDDPANPIHSPRAMRRLVRTVAQWFTTVLCRCAAVSYSRHPAQATTEYALILLVAAVVAILVIGWATTGGGGGRIGGLFDSVLDMILRRADTAP